MTTEQITFNCSSCGVQLRVPASFAGVTGPCPGCKTPITAPTLDGLPPEPAAAPRDVLPAPSPPARHGGLMPPSSPIPDAPTPIPASQRRPVDPSPPSQALAPELVDGSHHTLACACGRARVRPSRHDLSTRNTIGTSACCMDDNRFSQQLRQCQHAVHTSSELAVDTK